MTVAVRQLLVQEIVADRRRVPRLAYNLTESAEALGIGRTTLYRWIGNGTLRTVTIRGVRRVTAEELKRIIVEGSDDNLPGPLPGPGYPSYDN